MDIDVLRLSFLAFIQGLTEFLPISSSAHLILPSALLGWEDQGLAFDVAVHLGTLLAVLIYFYRDLLAIINGCLLHVFKRQPSADSRLGWQILVATIPVIIAGFLLKDFVDEHFRKIVIIATTTIFFGFILWWSDKFSKGHTGLTWMTWKAAVIIGLAQVLALVPGTSRSGITMTAALFCHLDRHSASRFSFLLSIPTIAGAALLLVLDLLQQTDVNWLELGYGLVLSGVVAYACISLFLGSINRLGFLPFVIYRLLLGAVLFIFFV